MLPHLAVSKLIHLAYESVEEFTVVANDYSRSVECLYGFLKYVFRRHVEMIGGLVKDKEIHRREQQSNHCQSASLTSA